MSEVIIDEEFQRVIERLTDNEYEALEKSIVKEGCRDPLVTWNSILIDGHHRYEICNKHGIPFHTITAQEDFNDRFEVKLWMIENQKSRRNWNLYRRAKSVLKLEDEIRERAKEQQGMRTDLSPNSGKGYKPIDTERELASLAEVGHDTMNKVMLIEQYATSEESDLLVEGKVSINEIHRKIKRRMSEVEVEPPPLPEGKYNVIYADPRRRWVLLCVHAQKATGGLRFVVKKWLTIWIMFCIILVVIKMKQQTGRKLKRVNWTMPEDVVDWLKSQSEKAGMSISLYLTKLIEKDKDFFDLTEK